MKAFVWTNVMTGAYHEDGVAVVLAESEEQARELLEAFDATPDEYGFDRTYHFSGKALSADTKLAIFELDAPGVIATYEGCDC